MACSWVPGGRPARCARTDRPACPALDRAGRRCISTRHPGRPRRSFRPSPSGGVAGTADSPELVERVAVAFDTLALHILILVILAGVQGYRLCELFPAGAFGFRILDRFPGSVLIEPIGRERSCAEAEAARN